MKRVLVFLFLLFFVTFYISVQSSFAKKNADEEVVVVLGETYVFKEIFVCEDENEARYFAMEENNFFNNQKIYREFSDYINTFPISCGAIGNVIFTPIKIIHKYVGYSVKQQAGESTEWIIVEGSALTNEHNKMTLFLFLPNHKILETPF